MHSLSLSLPSVKQLKPSPTVICLCKRKLLFGFLTFCLTSKCFVNKRWVKIPSLGPDTWQRKDVPNTAACLSDTRMRKCPHQPVQSSVYLQERRKWFRNYMWLKAVSLTTLTFSDTALHLYWQYSVAFHNCLTQIGEMSSKCWAGSPLPPLCKVMRYPVYHVQVVLHSRQYILMLWYSLKNVSLFIH